MDLRPAIPRRDGDAGGSGSGPDPEARVRRAAGQPAAAHIPGPICLAGPIPPMA